MGPDPREHARVMIRIYGRDQALIYLRVNVESAERRERGAARLLVCCALCSADIWLVERTVQSSLMAKEIDRDVHLLARVQSERTRASREELAQRLHWLGDLVTEMPLDSGFYDLARRALQPIFSLLSKIGHEAPFSPIVVATPRPLIERVSRASLIRLWVRGMWWRCRGRAAHQRGRLPLEPAARR